MIGRSIRHYGIFEKLGEGGMGVVYKARDTHLDRLVAIKVLSAGKVTDPDRKRRFVQEAKAASALNHPNIITIYDIDQSGPEGPPIDFIAMEYVAGKTLDQLIGRKGLPRNEALEYALQIADALAAAHRAGIIHRDLKPGNVMVTESGTVKVLDFGLAKLTESPASLEDGATRTMRPATEEGVIVGTVSYMSPEQAEGKPVDARSDIFSFGTMLYEMVTGQQAFRGDSRMSTLAAVLTKDPQPLSEVSPTVPRDLEKLISRCLRKDPERRIQHMDDVKLALQELKEEAAPEALSAVVAPQKRGRMRFFWAAGALAGFLALIAGGVYLGKSGKTSEPPLAAVPLTTYPGFEGDPSFSPDGNQVAFTWDGEKQDNFDIYVKLIGGGPPLRLTNDPAADTAPAWSPDGRSIAFVRRSDKTELFLISALGGPERKLAELENLPRGGTLSRSDSSVAWSPDGRYLIYPASTGPNEPWGLFLLPIATGERQRLTAPPETAIGDDAPAVSPDGRTVAFVRLERALVGHLCLLPLSGNYLPAGEPRCLAEQVQWFSTPAWTADSREIIYSVGQFGSGRLWRVRVSGSGQPTPLASAGEDGYEAAISRQGNRLVYATATWDCDIWRVEVSHRGETKPPLKLIASTRQDFNPQYSPDGRRIAFASTRSGDYEIWVCDQDGSNALQLSFFRAHTGTPRWFPDGRRIVFDSNKEGQFEIYVVDAGGGVPRRLTRHPASDAAPSVSRDGRWIYFSSQRTGRWEVWRMPAEGGEAVQVTRNGGFVPFESPDGKVLYYQKGEEASDVWKVPVDGGEEMKVLEPVGPRMFVLVNHGIYFIGPDAHGRRALQFFDVATGVIRIVMRIEKNLEIGLGASPDGRSVLYSQLDQVGSDLRLVENFR